MEPTSKIIISTVRKNIIEIMENVRRYPILLALIQLAVLSVPSIVSCSQLPYGTAKPLIFTNNASFRRSRRAPITKTIRQKNTHVNSKERASASLTSSKSYAATYDDYEDGEDEWDRLEQIKRELQNKLGGYRPWSIDTSSQRPGQYSWTSKIILANVIVYGLQMWNPNVTKMFAKRSDLIMSGKELYRLFTPMFLHGSVSHLLLNSYSLNNIGPEVERLFGTGRFLATYVAGGIAGNIASAYYTPNPSLGASGAVFGLMGAYYTFLSRNEELFGRSAKSAMGRVGSTLGMNILFGLASPSIDNWAHIGGGVGGVAMATAFGPKLFLMGLPNGGRIIVDKPAVRLPPSIEAIPGKFTNRLRRGRRRMQVHRYQSELKARPWRRSRFQKWKPRQRQRRQFDRKPKYGE